MSILRNYLCLCLALSAALQACSASSDKLLALKDLEPAKQVNVVRYEFPGYVKETTGSKVATVAIMAPFILFGAVGGGIGGALGGAVGGSMARSAGKEMQEKYKLPDFAELVHKSLAEKLSDGAPGWPTFVGEPNAISGEKQKPSGYVMTIKTVVAVSNGDGLRTATDAEITDPEQHVLWKKVAEYKSRDAKHPASFDALEAEDGKPLRDEVEFAVQRTVEMLLDHLHNREAKKTSEAPPAN